MENQSPITIQRPMSRTLRCIYCLEVKPRSSFNREHVIPEAFGTFKESLVLHQTVCADCNTSLGRDLDRTMARGSLEGALRLFRGLKTPDRSGDILRTRVRIVLPRSPDWEGVIVYLSPSRDGSSVVTKLPPQIGLRRIADGKWEYRTLEEIERDGFPSGVLRAKGCGVRLAYSSEADGRRVREVMASSEIPFSGEHGFTAPAREGEEIEVVVWGTFDNLSRRAVAKIAFNYLAWKMGAPFVLHPGFHELRRYILNGDEIDPPLYVRTLVMYSPTKAHTSPSPTGTW